MATNRLAMILALGLMVILVLIGVMLRYFTNESLVWAEELSRYLMVWLTFLGIGPVLRFGGHVAVDSLLVALSAAQQRVARVIVAILIAGFCVYLIYAGCAYVGRTWHQSTPVLDVPFGLVALAAPVGFALTLWHLLMIVGGYVRDGSFEESDDLDPQQAAAS
jgi:TRAP-type C4-dicarboxylate transport system permease small subunit